MPLFIHIYSWDFGTELSHKDSLLSRVSSSAPWWPLSTAALKQGSRQTLLRLCRASVTRFLPARNSNSSLHWSSASWRVRDSTSRKEILHDSLHLCREPAPPRSQPAPPSAFKVPALGWRTGNNRASRRERCTPLTHSSSGLRWSWRGRKWGEWAKRMSKGKTWAEMKRYHLWAKISLL